MLNSQRLGVQDMKLSEEKIVELYRTMEQKRPIVHCITNAVTVNDCANILLAVGASPTMAHHPMEAAEITQGATSLVCNFGEIADYEAMLLAGRKAHELDHAIVVDPVGVSGSTYRREKCIEFIEAVHPTCIRGNYSEIRALMENCTTITGVDAAPEDAHLDEQEAFLMRMKQYAKEKQMIIIASGETDLMTDGENTCACHRGDAMMAKITGSGCMSSVMLGAFLGVEKSFASAAAAVTFMGMAGERAAAKTREIGGGTMTFRQLFIDEIYLLTNR